jgi:hypothetical protein
MILFNLTCGKEHSFEAWFRDGATYDKQAAGGRIACPVCGDTHVRKAPMAPRLGRAKGDGKGDDAGARARQMRAMLSEIRDHVEKNCDYVGDRFAEEARKIHYGETEKNEKKKPRGIYGEATDAEAKSLKDEGIEFGRVPWVPPEDA